MFVTERLIVGKQPFPKKRILYFIMICINYKSIMLQTLERTVDSTGSVLTCLQFCLQSKSL